MKFLRDYFLFMKKYICGKKTKFFLMTLNELFKRATLVIIPMLTQVITDGAIYGGGNLRKFYVQAALLVVFTFLSVIFTTFDYKLKNRTKVCIVNEIRGDALSDLMRSDNRRLSLGAIYERINGDTEQTASFLINDMFKFVFSAVYVVVVVVIMLRMNILLSVLILILFPMTIGINLIYAPVFEKRNSAKKKDSDSFNAHVETLYSADLTIKSYNIVSFMNRITGNYLNRYRKSVYSEIRAVAFFDFFLLTLVLNLGTILPLTVGIYLSYKKILTIGEVTAFSLFCSRLWNPIEFFMDFPATLAERKNSFCRLKELFSVKSGSPDAIADSDEPPLPSFRELHINGIGCEIDGNRIFSGISLDVNKGDRVAVIGKNGSGKTTIGKMLVKMGTPAEGQIFYNDIPFDEISPQLLREKIVYVPPRAFIFPFSLSENIYFDTEQKAIRIEDFSILRHIQESHKDELSVNSCSEGEKKLIEIFRALNKDAELYIFDEPLAYLDKDNKNFVINLIMRFMEEKTVIFITHEKELMERCGKVLEL